jgi:hypothetical protein
MVQSKITIFVQKLVPLVSLFLIGLRSGWFIDNIKLTTNKGRVFGPFGG